MKPKHVWVKPVRYGQAQPEVCQRCGIPRSKPAESAPCLPTGA